MALKGRIFKTPNDCAILTSAGESRLCYSTPSPALELRHLRYAIAVAEELHFGRAAERLHLAAPSLSKQIKNLEAILGYQLFNRSTRGVLITPSGELFVEEARRAMLHVGRAISSGAAAVHADRGVLDVGYTPWFDPTELLAIRKVFANQRPDTQVVFHSVFSNGQLDLIISGGLDAGIVVLPVVAAGLQTHCIRRESLMIALLETHALAGQPKISMSQLSGEPMIWVAKSVEPILHEHLLRSCQKSGFAPNIAYEVATVTEALDLVSAGAGMVFIKISTGVHLTRRDVVYREIAEPGLTLEIGVAYHADNHSEALEVLLGVLEERPPLPGPVSHLEVARQR